LGDVNSDVNLKVSKDGKLSYSGSIAAIQFDLGKLMAQDSMIGKISVSADVVGKNWLNQNPEVTVNGTLQEFQYHQYNYQNITLNGVLKQNQFNGIIESKDPNIDFKFNGVVNVNDSLPVYNFKADVRNVNLECLHFSQKPFSITHAKVAIDAMGNTIDNFSGSASVANFSFDVNNVFYQLHQFNLSSKNKNDGKELLLMSDVGNLKVDGKFN